MTILDKIKIEKMTDSDLKIEGRRLADQISDLEKSISQLSSLYSSTDPIITNRNLHEFEKLMKKYRKEKTRIKKKLEKLNSKIKGAQFY